MNHNFMQQEIAKNGEITLKYKNYYLHSKYNPIKEAVNFVENNYEKASKQILIGYGAGYIYKELSKEISDDEMILVIDPFVEMENKDNFLSKLDTESIKDFLNKYLNVTDTFNLMISINYDKIIVESEELKDFIELLKEKIGSLKITENTLTFFTAQWNENYLRNLPFSQKDHSIKELFNDKATPVVVAAGGPSLTKQLPLLKKYRDRIILVAAGTTINSLLSNDIRPDLVVSIDGGEVNYNHFKNLEINDFPLVYCPTVHYGIRDSFKHAYYFILSMEEELISHYEKYCGKHIETLIGGSSVAHSAYNLALFLSNGPVALIGQDLAYTNGETHAKGNLNFKKKENELLLLKEGYYGGLVETDEVFLQMKDGFETILTSMNAEDISYNCTEGGLKIPFFKQLPFEAFLEKYANEKIELDYLYDEMEQSEKYSKEIIKNYKNDIKRYKELIIIFNDALFVLKNNKSTVGYDNKVLKKLDKLDREIQRKVVDLNLSYASAEITLNLMKYFKTKKDDSFKNKFEKSYDQTKYMYENMKKITNDSLEILKELLEKAEK